MYMIEITMYQNCFIDFYSCIAKFDEFARDIMAKASQPIIIPEGGNVFDYVVDCKLGVFVRWCDRQTEKTRNLPASYIVIPEVRSTLSTLLVPFSP